MSENTVKNLQNPDNDKINEILSKFEHLNTQEKTLITREIIKKLNNNQIGDIHQFIQPLLDCNLIVSLHQSGHSRLVNGILDFLDPMSMLHLESTCLSILSIIRIHLSWKTLIEQKMAHDPIWEGIVRRRGWTKYFHVSDLRQVKNPDFYHKLYPLITREIHDLQNRWHTGRYLVKRIEFDDTNGVYCLQYDEDKIVSGHRDNTVKFWNVRKGCVEKVLVGHSGSVLCLQFDDRRLITGSSDCTIRVWDVVSGREMQRLMGHTQPVLYLRYDDNILVTCSKDTKAIVWAEKPGEGMVVEKVLSGHRAAVNVVDFDESYIVTASGDRTIQVWSRETFTVTTTLMGHKRGIACLQQRGNIVASGSSDKTIRIWDILEGVCLRVLNGHDDLVRCIRFNQNYIVSGSYDAKIKIWDFKSIMSPGWNSREHCLATLREHSGRVFRLMFDQFQIMTCSHDDTIVVWNFFNDNATRSVGSPFD